MMLYSCTHTATVGVKGLNTFLLRRVLAKDVTLQTDENNNIQ